MTIFHEWTFFVTPFWTLRPNKSKNLKWRYKKSSIMKNGHFIITYRAPIKKIGKNSILENWIMFRWPCIIVSKVKLRMYYIYLIGPLRPIWYTQISLYHSYIIIIQIDLLWNQAKHFYFFYLANSFWNML
jgi:hypothetical protein